MIRLSTTFVPEGGSRVHACMILDIPYKVLAKTAGSKGFLTAAGQHEDSGIQAGTSVHCQASM